MKPRVSENKAFFAAAILFTAMVYVHTAAAQGTKGGSSSAPSPNSTANGPEASSDIGKFNEWNRLLTDGRPGEYFGGKVTVAGGMLPWDPIDVTVNCNGADKYTVDTDAKGQFVIAPTVPAGSAPSAPDSRPHFSSELIGCTVSAFLPGFDSSTVTIANRNLHDSPDIGVITLKPESGPEGGALSSTTAAAPKDALKNFEKARADWFDKKPDRAEKDLEKAVQIYPQFAEAWYQLGKIQQNAKSADAAASFNKAAAADPKFALPYEHLAQIAVLSAKWDDLLSATSHEIELNPRGSPWTWYYNALANYNLGKKNVAEASAKKSLSMDPLHTVQNTDQLLAVLLAGRGDYAGALEHLRSALTYLPPGPNADLIKQQISQLQGALVSQPK
jgi:tetratricopeptide (TPR) repeat protein